MNILVPHIIANLSTSAIYGGGNGTTVSSTDLTVLSGNFLKIYGGGNGGTVSGDTNALRASKKMNWTVFILL